MSSDCQVSVSSGVLQGKESKTVGGKDYFSFLGVPYAEPPVGELRFKAPIPKKPWPGILDATKEGDCPPQLDMFTRVYIGNENCLYLNIYAPNLPVNKENDILLPVMVFIHGGAFLFMSGSADWFTPDFIVESNVILVTINFRLSALGFLCLDIPEAPGNAGLKDQHLALKWVKENISKFNGDSDNITIFGISSGGASVEYHLISPLSKGLFNKAIIQSGSVLNPWARVRTPKKMAEKLATILGVEEKDPHKLCKIFQEIDAEKFASAAYKVAGDDEYKNCDMFSFTPVVEKKFPGIEAFIDEEPLEILKDGRFMKVATITGFCSQEGHLYKTHFSDSLKQQLYDKMYSNFIPSYYKIDKATMQQNLCDIYISENQEENADNFLSDVHFISGIFESVRLRSLADQNKNYLYEFTYEGNINFLKSVFKMQVKGALHGDESTYLSSSKYVDESLATEEDEIVRRRVVKMWTDFAKFGNPTTEKSSLITTKWQPVSDGGRPDEVMLLDINKEMKMTPFPYTERFQIWEKVYKN